SAAPLAAFVEVLPDPANSEQGYDPRSWARKALDTLESLMSSGSYSPQIKRYEIAGRVMEFNTREDVFMEMGRLRTRVWGEKRNARRDAGLPSGRHVQARFVR